MLNIFKDLQKGKVNNIDFSEFTQVKMNNGGIMGFISDWWPVNFIDTIGNKISQVFGKKWTFVNPTGTSFHNRSFTMCCVPVPVKLVVSEWTGKARRLGV